MLYSVPQWSVSKMFIQKDYITISKEETTVLFKNPASPTITDQQKKTGSQNANLFLF